MATKSLPKEFLEIIFRHAEKEYPKECCGLVLGPLGQSGYSRVRPCRNVYDECHQKEPEHFPRTSRNAYFIDPSELLAVQKELRLQKQEIKIIYHSHVDTGAYFSEEDKRAALLNGESAYPGVDYGVVSVIAGKVAGAALYRCQKKEGQAAFTKKTISVGQA